MQPVQMLACCRANSWRPSILLWVLLPSRLSEAHDYSTNPRLTCIGCAAMQPSASPWALRLVFCCQTCREL